MKTTSRLIHLGSAERQTRADSPGPKTELNPIFTYEDGGVRAEIIRLGQAATQTRATADVGQLELIPVSRWEMPS